MSAAPLYVTEDTVSKPDLLIETPTSIRRKAPEVVWEMVRLEPAVEPEDTASTSAISPGIGVWVGGVVVGVGLPGSGVGVEVGSGPEP